MDNTMEKYREYVITSFTKAVQPIVIEQAHGAVVVDSAGREYIDCFAGISVVNAGHGNPEVVAAAQAQMEKLIHCCLVCLSRPARGRPGRKAGPDHAGALEKELFRQ